MSRPALCALILTIGSLGACAEYNADATSPGDVVSFARGGGSSDVPVTVTIDDTPTFQIRSDALGTYTNSSSLTSIIQGIGAWLLDSYNPSTGTRRAFLEFSQPIAGSGPGGGAPVAVPSALYRFRAISKCNLLGTSFLTLAPGASMPCPLHLKFAYAGGSYAVQMNPGASAADPDGNAPETNYATITCVVPSSGAGPCTSWTITPSGTGNQNVAKLFKYVTSKGKTTAVNQGNFYFSFRISVTRS